MKKFNWDKFGSKDCNVINDLSDIYTNDRYTYIETYLEPFQNLQHKKGINEPKRIKISFNVDGDSNMTGVIDNFQIKIESFDGQSQIFELSEVDPVQLFWIGKLFIKVAKHYNIDMKEQRNKYNNNL